MARKHTTALIFLQKKTSLLINHSFSPIHSTTSRSHEVLQFLLGELPSMLLDVCSILEDIGSGQPPHAETVDNFCTYPAFNVNRSENDVLIGIGLKME